MVANAPAGQRRFHELLFTHGNITYCYHSRAKDFKPTQEDWRDWLEGLPANIRQDMEKEGFEQCKKAFPFTRYVMEKNDVGLDEYVRQRMAPDDYREYMEMIEKRKA
jgi:hypothetical protein